MKRVQIIFLSVLLMMLLTACNNNTSTDNDAIDTEGQIVFTQQQFEAAQMQIGNPQEHTLSEIIHTNGYLHPSPDGIANVTTLISGRVSGVRHAAGDYVKKGTPLFEISGNEVVNIQHDYVKSCANFDLAEQELQRVTELVDEHITAKKSLLNTRNTYKLALAEKQALLARLKMINIDPNKVEKGNIEPSLQVKVPISGYLSEFNLENGQYIDQQYMAAKIVDNQKLRLILNVFEKDIKNLQAGQVVQFYDPDRKNEKHTATLRSIGQSIDAQTKTIPCIADIDHAETKRFLDGMYAECHIETSKHTILALPATALIAESDGHYVLVKISETNNQLLFEKVKVETGQSDSEYTEIKTNGLSNVLVKGVYYYNIGE